MAEETQEITVSVADIVAGISLDTSKSAKVSVSGLSGGFLIETTLTAAGGTPLANEPVSIIDSDTNRKVATVTSDANGVVRAKVPRKTEYHFFVESEAAEPDDNPFADVVAGGASHADLSHPMLFVEIFDADGKPVAGETVTVTDEDGGANEATTDESGNFQLVAGAAGAHTIAVRGQSFLAHTMFADDFPDAPTPYRFTLA